MRLIDADELLEYVYRDKLDTRERIAALIERMPTVQPEEADCTTCKHGYFGSIQCNRCSHGYADNYERDERYG